MTALTANRSTEFLEHGRIWRTFDVAADAVIFAGAIVGVNTDGYLVPASAISTLKIVGIACTEQDATDLAAGALEVEVDANIALLVNGSSSITANDVESLCYAGDDQTVYLSNGGTSQVTRGDFVFSTTDPVGLTVDGLSIFVASNTSDDQTVADFVAYWNAHPVAKLLATATADTSGAESYGILTFLDSNVHTVVAYSPATADVTGITNTTAAVAATRPVAGTIHQVDTGGVYVRFID